MSMTSKVRPYKYGFGPFAPEVYRLPYPYEYRGRYAGAAAAAASLEEFFKTQVAAEKVACVVLELVLGEGGFVVAPREYVAALARICREHGILLVVDEVQTGFGRTGRMFACEHYGLEPDLVTMAKSLAGGLPLSAVTGRADVMDSAQVGGLGGTYAGNPVACAAALAAIDVPRGRTASPNAPPRSAAPSRPASARFVDRFPFVGDARGLGAMRALEIVRTKRAGSPTRTAPTASSASLARRASLLVGAGTFGNVIRTLMPLVITDDELAEGLDVLEHALQEA